MIMRRELDSGGQTKRERAEARVSAALRRAGYDPSAEMESFRREVVVRAAVHLKGEGVFFGGVGAAFKEVEDLFVSQCLGEEVRKVGLDEETFFFLMNRLGEVMERDEG